MSHPSLANVAAVAEPGLGAGPAGAGSRAGGVLNVVVRALCFATLAAVLALSVVRGERGQAACAPPPPLAENVEQAGQAKPSAAPPSQQPARALGAALASEVRGCEEAVLYRLGAAAEADAGAGGDRPQVAGQIVLARRALEREGMEKVRDALLHPSTVVGAAVAAPMAYDYAISLRCRGRTSTLLIGLDPIGLGGQIVWVEGRRRYRIEREQLSAALAAVLPEQAGQAAYERAMRLVGRLAGHRPGGAPETISARRSW